MENRKLVAPWAAYEPTGADPWDLRKVAHLHRRAGFGATWVNCTATSSRGRPRASTDSSTRPICRPTSRRSLTRLRKGAIGSANLERLKAYWLYRMRIRGGPAPRED